jgi:hypothetical protein
MNERTLANPHSEEFEVVNEILSGISITRARQGFTPRETGLFVFSLKDALQQILQDEIKNDPQALYDASQKVNKLMDAFAVVTFETFIKGREDVILRQTDEITEISTPVIRIWDGILALPIIGTLRFVPHADSDGKPAAGNCEHRQHNRHTGYFRRANRRLAGSPTPYKDRFGYPPDGRRMHHQRHSPGDRPNRCSPGHRPFQHRYQVFPCQCP